MKKVLTKKLGADRMKRLTPATGPKGASRGFLRPKKSYLLIDGENFVHRVEEALKDRGLIRNRLSIKKIDFDTLFGFARGATKNYYATILRIPKSTHPLFKKIEKIRSWQFKWVPYLISRQINYVKGGYLRVRDGKKCSKCGNTAEILMEKGVDVRIAVDMVMNAGEGVVFYLVSSDTDLLPAIEAARKRGARVVYVAFEEKEVKLISRYASEVILIKQAQVARAFRKVKR